MWWVEGTRAGCPAELARLMQVDIISFEQAIYTLYLTPFYILNFCFLFAWFLSKILLQSHTYWDFHKSVELRPHTVDSGDKHKTVSFVLTISCLWANVFTFLIFPVHVVKYIVRVKWDNFHKAHYILFEFSPSVIVFINVIRVKGKMAPESFLSPSFSGIYLYLRKKRYVLLWACWIY